MIPLILGAIALGTAAVGIAKGSEGIGNINEAREIGESAQARYRIAINQLKANQKNVEKWAESYGQLQLDVQTVTIKRFVILAEKIGQRASRSDISLMTSLEGISTQNIQKYKAVALEAEQLTQGLLGVAATGIAAGYGAVGLVGLFGTASTGAAISGLSGAAATNATLAWLGGGAIAAGGGGMALGTAVLGGIVVGPALAVGGFMLAAQGEEALAKAREYAITVNTEVPKIEAACEFLKQVKQRIHDLRKSLKGLNAKTLSELDELESWFSTQEKKLSLFQKFCLALARHMPTFFSWLKKPHPLFENTDELKRYQNVALLIKALTEIIQTPVLDKQGNLSAKMLKSVKESAKNLLPSPKLRPRRNPEF
jgi:hypothetical protein